MEESGVGSNCSVLLVRIVENFEGVGEKELRMEGHTT